VQTRPPNLRCRTECGISIFLTVALCALHLIGYVEPEMFVESRAIRGFFLPIFLLALLAVPKRLLMSSTSEDWVGERARHIFLLLAIVEVSFFVALVFPGLEEHIHVSKFLELTSHSTVAMQSSRFEYLVAFSMLGSVLSPWLVEGLRKCGILPRMIRKDSEPL
jgi:hypothetical protein